MNAVKVFGSAFQNSLDRVFVPHPKLTMQYKRKPIMIGFADEKLASLVAQRYDAHRPNARMIGRTWDDVGKGNVDPDVQQGLKGLVCDADATLILGRDSNGPHYDICIEEMDGFEFFGMPVVKGVGICLVWDTDMHPKERSGSEFDVEEFRRMFPYVGNPLSVSHPTTVDAGYRKNIYLRALCVYPERTPVYALNEMFEL